MKEQEYEKFIDEKIVDINKNPGNYLTPDDVVADLDPEFVQHNLRLMNAATGSLKFTPVKMKSAMGRRVKQVIKNASQKEWDVEVIQALGAIPETEKEFVERAMIRSDYRMRYAGDFVHSMDRTDVRTADRMHKELKSLASQLDLVKPRGKILGIPAIQNEFDIWCADERIRCKAAMIRRLMELPEGSSSGEVLGQFRQLCDYYFREPEFAYASIIKGMWQIKRRLNTLPVKEMVMIVLMGAQMTAKSTVMRAMLDPINELAAETTIHEILDQRNTDMRALYAVFLDEMTGAGRAEVTAIKNLITAQFSSARVLYTNNTQNTPVNVTLFGSSNKPLGSVVYDSTGMRRFIELEVKSYAEIEPHWQFVKTFDWLALWQAVDMDMDDPLIPYSDLLREKQEEMRAKDAVEAWAMQFDPTQSKVARRLDNGSWRFAAAELYRDDFLPFEEAFFRANHGTSVSRWGIELKGLIQMARLPHWSYKKINGAMFYSVPQPDGANVVPLETKGDPLARLKAKMRQHGNQD